MPDTHTHTTTASIGQGVHNCFIHTPHAATHRCIVAGGRVSGDLSQHWECFLPKDMTRTRIDWISQTRVYVVGLSELWNAHHVTVDANLMWAEDFYWRDLLLDYASTVKFSNGRTLLCNESRYFYTVCRTDSIMSNGQWCMLPIHEWRTH